MHEQTRRQHGRSRGYRVGVSTAAIAAVVLSLAACGTASNSGASSTGSRSSTGTVNILAITDSSGPVKQQGSQELIGLDAAAAFYNAKGGIDHHRVVIDHVNDNGDPATAVSVAEKALGNDPGKYSMVYAGEEGTDIDALIPVMARYPVFATNLTDSGACIPTSHCPHEFSLEGATSIPQQRVAEFMKQNNYTKVGILEEEISFTESETPALTKYLSQDSIGNSVVTFPTSALTLTTELQQLKSSGADVVYAEALGPAAGYVLQARASLGWNVPVVFDVAGSSIDLSTLASAAELKNADVVMKRCADPAKASSTPGYSELSKYAARYGGMGDNPCNLAGAGWDSVVFLNQLVAQTGSFNYATLTKAAQNVKPRYRSSPNYVVIPKYFYSATDHENLGETTADWSVLPAGPIVNGQLSTSS